MIDWSDGNTGNKLCIVLFVHLFPFTEVSRARHLQSPAPDVEEGWAAAPHAEESALQSQVKKLCSSTLNSDTDVNRFACLPVDVSVVSVQSRWKQFLYVTEWGGGQWKHVLNSTIQLVILYWYENVIMVWIVCKNKKNYWNCYISVWLDSFYFNT